MANHRQLFKPTRSAYSANSLVSSKAFEQNKKKVFMS